jgi:L,D-peptidoglycan transpeptidase YkuD (ErfK/YbiS/YcfS/YnhG family)
VTGGRVVAVLGYSRRRDTQIHPVCASRLEYGQQVAAGARAVILSGSPEAELMRAAWTGPDVELVIDPDSNHTAENVAHVVAVARSLGADELVVVTSRWHQARVRVLLRAALRGSGIRFSVEAPPGPRPPLLLAREAACFAVLPLQLRAARTIVMSALAALALAAPANAGRELAPGCPSTLANELAWTGSARQLVTVETERRSSTLASLRLWRKVGRCWHPVGGAQSAWVGQRGVNPRKREGDRTTPAGAFPFARVMYGIAADPGVRYRYRRVVCGDWWVEDPRSPYYNRFRHVPCGSTPPFRTTSEDLSRSPTAYRHFAVIGYNTDPIVPGKGSGIFLHASTGRPTLGCVSLPVGSLVRVLRWLRPASAPLIVIGTQAEIRRY